MSDVRMIVGNDIKIVTQPQNSQKNIKNKVIEIPMFIKNQRTY